MTLTPGRISDSLPPIGIDRVQAAEYVGIDVTLFDRLVAEGRMPEPRTIYGRLIWDATEIARAFRQFPHRASGTDTSPKAYKAVEPAEGKPGYSNVYTPESLAKRWGCSARHVRAIISDGELPAFKLGDKLLRINAKDVEAFEQRGGDVEDMLDGADAVEETQPGAPASKKPALTKQRARPLLSRQETRELHARWAREKPTAST
jgi:excisionase family DNA binding protein